jgi:hypothetical protein
MDAWRSWTKESAELYHKLRIVAGRFTRRHMAAALQGWREGIAERKRLVQLTRKVAKRIMLRDVAAAWRQWRSVTARGVDRKYKALMQGAASHASERESWLIAANGRGRGGAVGAAPRRGRRQRGGQAARARSRRGPSR